MDSPIPSLFRYYMCMSLARQNFYKDLPTSMKNNEADHAQAGMEFLFSKARIWMQIWYGLLYVVIEGWEQSGLVDAEIETLLKNTSNVAKLKRFRHAVFHYQKQFLPVKQEGLFAERSVVEWITILSDALKRKLTAAMEEESAKP